jgi:hypothetical protein
MSSRIMSRSTSLALGLSVCGAVAALAASPARADDGVPSPADPTTIIATALASASSVPEPQVAVTPQLPSAPAVPQTPVIPSVSPTIPPTIPPAAGDVEAPPAPSPTVTTSSPSTPTPSVEPSTTATPPPPDASAPEPTTAPGDTGNTAADNSNGITADSVTPTSQTFVWNWFWNCASDEGVPAVPEPPTGATMIVLNWHWACAEPPPPIDVAGITICTSCNIAISVRVGSPGDTGDVAQSILASATAAAADVADTIQRALQTATPPSASPAASPLPDPIAEVAAAPPAAVQAATLRIDDGVLIEPPASAPSEDLPRHGAPTAFGGGSAGPPSVGDQARSRADIALGEPTPAAVRARVALLQPWIARRVVARSERVAKPPRAQAKAPQPIPQAPSPSEPPTPFILAAGVAPTHGGGIGVVTALASGLAMVLLYSISTALRLVLVVPPDRAAGANPHPPG